jgi:hypothetical protein
VLADSALSLCAYVTMADAADGWRVVNALTISAAQLTATQDFPRAAENYTRAVAAARALGAEDCLVVVTLQALQAESLLFHAGEQPRSAAEKAAMRHHVFLTLLPACMQAAERRRTAGTLRAGACRASEEAWFVTRMSAEHAHMTGFDDDAEARAVAELCRVDVGYDAFLHTAFVVLFVLQHAFNHACDDDGAGISCPFVVPTALLQQSCAFAAHALDMRTQRGNQTVALSWSSGWCT